MMITVDYLDPRVRDGKNNYNLQKMDEKDKLKFKNVQYKIVSKDYTKGLDSKYLYKFEY